MSLRIIETLIPLRYEKEVRQLLKDMPLIDCWDGPTSGQRIAFRLLVRTDQTEAVLDALERNFDFEDEFRCIVTAIEAAHPWPKGVNEDAKIYFRPVMGRVSRQELYQDIHKACGITPLFLAMVVLSAVAVTICRLQSA